jgi:hypothetical protein
MRVLFDQGTPAPLRHALAPHEVSTAFELGWSKLENGDLLHAAEGRFEVFITTDHSDGTDGAQVGLSLSEAQPRQLNFPQ